MRWNINKFLVYGECHIHNNKHRLFGVVIGVPCCNAIFLTPNTDMSHTIYAAKFEQTIIHQHVHLRQESQSHAPVHVLMRLYPVDKSLVWTSINCLEWSLVYPVAMQFFWPYPFILSQAMTCISNIRWCCPPFLCSVSGDPLQTIDACCCEYGILHTQGTCLCSTTWKS
jgi:hypothetical protein